MWFKQERDQLGNFLFFILAGTVVLKMAVLVVGSICSLQTEISQQLWDVLLLNRLQIFTVTRGFILMTLVVKQMLHYNVLKNTKPAVNLKYIVIFE